MYRTSRLALACSTTLLLAACAKKEPVKDTTAAMAPAAATPAPAPAPALALTDVAGKWSFRAVPTTGKDTSATLWELNATADTATWTMTFKSGLKVPVHAHVSGDSLHLAAGPFPSQRRKSVKVNTETALKLEGGKLVGQTIAHYANAGADSVLVLHSEGTKAP
jgi:hypothetical protein